MLTHFEFYAHRVKNEKPLFDDPLKVSSTPNYSYTFEEKIDKVLAELKLHLSSMDLFFRNRYSNFLTPESFRKSIYCLKYNHWNDPPPVEGYFFSTKIITSHIDYIDNFRRYILGFTNLASPEIPIINEKLINKIEIYIELLDNSKDNRAKDEFCDIFRSRIKIIRDSKFQNTTEIIN